MKKEALEYAKESLRIESKAIADVLDYMDFVIMLYQIIYG